MVEAGRKAHRRHASELEARRRELAEIAREVEEERETALIATAVLNEARDDLRLQYGSRAAELGKKLDAARGVLDAAAARERRAAENEAASRQREEALEARATALEERARALDAKERDLADREAAVATREATLAAHGVGARRGGAALGGGMVEAGRKAHRRHALELEARRRELAEIAREVEEERETALIATAMLDEVRDDHRLQYGSRAAELEKKLDAARGVLDAAAARERRAAENEAASRRREEALEARAMALEERAGARERDLADREAAVAIREATLAAHEAACAEEESALRLREDALTERLIPGA